MLYQFKVSSGERKVYFAILSDINMVLIFCLISASYNVLYDLSELLFLIIVCLCIKTYLSVFVLRSLKK